MRFFQSKISKLDGKQLGGGGWKLSQKGGHWHSVCHYSVWSPLTGEQSDHKEVFCVGNYSVVAQFAKHSVRALSQWRRKGKHLPQLRLADDNAKDTLWKNESKKRGRINGRHTPRLVESQRVEKVLRCHENLAVKFNGSKFSKYKKRNSNKMYFHQNSLLFK